MTEFVALALTGISFLLSASAGLGGSLILVPALTLLLNGKEGIALASLLLAGNNVAKVITYRRTIPLSTTVAILVCLTIGTAVGARLLIALPDRWVSAVVVAFFVSAFLAERMRLAAFRRSAPPVLALAAGFASGFSGTSGPLKGIAVRALGYDRFHFLGALSIISLVGDLTKVSIFAHARLLNTKAWWLMLAAMPLMVFANLGGYRFNQRAGEKAFAVLFWIVIAGYALRIVAIL